MNGGIPQALNRRPYLSPDNLNNELDKTVFHLRQEMKFLERGNGFDVESQQVLREAKDLLLAIDEFREAAQGE